jgi:hypothetical protein
MNICSKVYQVTITYQGESHTFSKNLSHDCHLSQNQINEAIIMDFFQEVMVEVSLPPCCPACEDYL